MKPLLTICCWLYIVFVGHAQQLQGLRWAYNRNVINTSEPVSFQTLRFQAPDTLPSTYASICDSAGNLLLQYGNNSRYIYDGNGDTLDMSPIRNLQEFNSNRFLGNSDSAIAYSCFIQLSSDTIALVYKVFKGSISSPLTWLKAILLVKNHSGFSIQSNNYQTSKLPSLINAGFTYSVINNKIYIYLLRREDIYIYTLSTKGFAEKQVVQISNSSINKTFSDNYPFISPNQRQIGFYTTTGVQIGKISTSGLIDSLIQINVKIKYGINTYAGGNATMAFSLNGKYLYLNGIQVDTIKYGHINRLTIDQWDTTVIKRSLTRKFISTPSFIFNRDPSSVLGIRNNGYQFPLQLTSDGRILAALYAEITYNPLNIFQITSPYWFGSIDCPDSPSGLATMRDSLPILIPNGIRTPPPMLSTAVFRNAGTLQALATRRRVCLGDTIGLRAFGATATRFSWQGPPGLSNNNSWNPRFTAQSLGLFTYVVTGSSTCTTATAQITVEVVAPPPANALGPDRLLCPGSNLQLTATGLSAGTVARWSTGQAGSTITVNAPGLYWVELDNGACLVRDSVLVTLTTKPSAPRITGLSLRQFCQGRSQVLRADTIGLGPIVGFQWLRDGQVINNTTDSILVTQAGRYQLRVRNAANCLSDTSLAVSITVLPLPLAPRVVGQLAVCLGDSSRLTVIPDTNIIALRWVGTASTGNSITVGAGNYSVIAISRSGCQSVATPITVRAIPLPVGQVVGVSTACPGSVVTYRFRQQDTSQIQSINWQVFGGQVVAQAADSVLIQWSGLRRGLVDLKAIATSRFGCSSDTIGLTVRLTTTLAPPQPTGLTAICAGTGAVAYLAADYGQATYQWQISGGRILQSAGRAANVLWDSSLVRGVIRYTVSQTTADTICNGRSDSLLIDILPSPRKDLQIAGELSRCGPGALTISLAGDPTSSYDWQPDTGLSIVGNNNAQSIILTSQRTGAYRIRVQETNPNGCTGPVFATLINVFAVPSVAIISSSRDSSAFVLCPEDEQAKGYSISPEAGFAAINWQVIGGQLIGSSQGPLAIVRWTAGLNQSRQIMVLATDTNGCEALAQVRVLYDSVLTLGCRPEDYPLIIPNIITPNNDGQNDRWVIDRLAYYPDHQVSVYDRYGRQVYTSNSYPQNLMLEGGTYYYLIRAGNRSYKGWLQVLK